jgi:hypothetical protein
MKLTRWQQLKLEREASKFPDIELMGFVSRGPLIVLQTHGGNFEVMTREEKLNTLDYIERSVRALRDQIKGE